MKTPLLIVARTSDARPNAGVRRRGTVFAGAALLAVLPGILAAGAGGPSAYAEQAAAVPASHAVPDKTLQWDVYRNGQLIGEHELVLRHENGDLIVENHIDIHVDLAFITLYRYRHDSREVWHDGKLLHLVATTNDDGTKHRVAAKRNKAGALVVDGSGGDFVASAGTRPSSLWRISMTQASHLLDLETGKLLSIQAADKGDETIIEAGRKIDAQLVSVTGDLKRDMWYGPDGILVAQKFRAPDGSEIDYRLDKSSG